MKTYIYQETDSPKRGCPVRITVHRIKRNRPHRLGHIDCDPASWSGAHGEAVQLINMLDRVPFATRDDGTTNRVQLRGELGPASKYDDTGHARNAVRLFGV